MKRILPVFILFLLITIGVEAQYTRYIVRFKNKAGTPHSLATPSTYLSQRSIDRRVRYSIAIDSTDLPVTPRYLDSVRLAGTVTILNVSKWLNQVSIQTSDPSALSKIQSFSFVESIKGIALRLTYIPASRWDKIEIASPIIANTQRITKMFDFYNYGNSFNQVHIHNGEFLHNIGLRGQGMVLSMLDGGFFNYTTLRAFDSINAFGQVLGTWDFVAREASVTEDNAHGMECLSTIAANIPAIFVGTAPKTNFYLFRTEDVNSEYPIEEHNWLCGVERADSSGTDVVSSSVGYNTFDDPSFDHTYAQMNGNTTVPAIAGDLAAKKGILVFNSAGNEGINPWHYIITPADGDSVVAVGAVTSSGIKADFSSFGPSSDGQIKPDIVSQGVATVVQLPNNTIGTNNGTSFSNPNIAGLATCLWQGFPEFNNMRIVQALKAAGTRANNPNDSIGYGIPDVRAAFVDLLKEFSSANGTENSCKATLNWTSKDVSFMKYEIERKAPGEAGYTKIGEKASGGNNVLSILTYQYIDTLKNIQAGTISYRIRQTIDTITGNIIKAYIDTINIALGTSCITTGTNPVNPNEEKITLLPNPAKSEFILKVKTSYPIQIMNVSVLDMKGRLMMRFSRSKGSGEASYSFPLLQLAKGKYIVIIYNSQKFLAAKELIKL